MNLIQAEKEAAKSKMLKLIPGTELVDLTRDNVAIVTAMISTDSAYRIAADKKAGPTKSYGGSGAFWYNQLKRYSIEHKPCDFVYEDIIMGIVAAVDRENSTHLNADGVGRNQITERIISHSPVFNVKIINPGKFFCIVGYERAVVCHDSRCNQ